LEHFLRKHAPTSMFLRSNARAAGLDDRGEIFQASYLGAFRRAELVGVMAHCWNGMILMQAPDIDVLEGLYRALLALPTITDRGIKGASGDYPQVRALIEWLKPDAGLVQMDTREDLFALALENLVIPPSLQQGDVICRRLEARDMAVVLPWRIEFLIEALQASRDKIEPAEEAAMLRNYVATGHGFVLEHGETGQLLSTSSFNAALPDVVQIGNVWTPPSLRGNAYARAVVAGQLLHARQDGVKQAVLFADNPAAIRVYESVGFKKIGDFGITLLRQLWFINR
jgi:RimJ/RimL family protein N-acetyltransferase